jgi:hypothetical protein
MDDIYNGQQKKSEFYCPEVEKMGRGDGGFFHDQKKKFPKIAGVSSVFRTFLIKLKIQQVHDY